MKEMTNKEIFEIEFAAHEAGNTEVNFQELALENGINLTVIDLNFGCRNDFSGEAFFNFNGTEYKVVVKKSKADILSDELVYFKVCQKIITRRHGMGTIEDILNINTSFAYIMNNERFYKVWRANKDNKFYSFDGVYSKDDLIEECNR